MKNKKEYLNRMNYLRGHLEGVRKMIEDNKYCVDIIHQNLGVISALHKLNEKILERHLETCVSRAIKGGKDAERKKVFKELTDIYKFSK
ncbi:MAG: metal-sensitive transcriptional regulator [Patescibacteria group bacterium]